MLNIFLLKNEHLNLFVNIKYSIIEFIMNEPINGHIMVMTALQNKRVSFLANVCSSIFLIF